MVQYIASAIQRKSTAASDFYFWWLIRPKTSYFIIQIDFLKYYNYFPVDLINGNQILVRSGKNG